MIEALLFANSTCRNHETLHQTLLVGFAKWLETAFLKHQRFSLSYNPKKFKIVMNERGSEND